MKSWQKYVLAAVLPMTVLLSKPLVPLAVMLFGDEARFEVTVLDPREIFRGDYVELSFEELERAALKIFEAQNTSGRDRAKYLYVSLKKDSKGLDRPNGVSLSPPKEGLYIRGKVGLVRLDFGDSLCRYYVKENTGLEIENAIREGRAEAVVKIWRGSPLLVSLDITPKATDK